MINRLISSLPFNPSLVEELSFYSKRLKKEESIRRLGFIMIVLSLLVQLFAASFPAEKSLAASADNDVIKGGPVNNLAELRSRYNSQAQARGLFQRFGLEPADLRDGGAEHVNFHFQSQGSQGTRTVGRVNFNTTNDQSVGVYAGQKFWSRNAGEWSGSENAFYFGKQQGTDGKYYLVWVLKNCGNIAYRPADAPPAKVGLADNKPVTKPKKEKPKPNKPTAAAPVTSSSSIPQPEDIPSYIRIEKFAENKTQNLNSSQTTETTAKAGDVIEYTLITKTTGDKPVENYTVEDYVGDLLDYSDLDASSISSQGGKYSSATKKITWDKQTVPNGPNGLKNTFKVTIKSPIPKTNSPNTTAPDFDCLMQNGYGNEIIIHVDCSVIKAVETLPNTGPGTNLAIAFGITSLSGYFLSRNKLLSKELWLVRKNYAASGDK